MATTMRRELRYRPIMTQEMKDAAVEALEDGRLIRSVYDESESDGAKFEAEINAYMGTDHAVAVSSGWAAMHVAFLAAGIGPGDEVITVPNSFISVGDVIELVGATPVFTDIDPGTFNMDPNRIEAAITPPYQSHHAGAQQRTDLRDGFDHDDRPPAQPAGDRRFVPDAGQ